jgi:hypothetical protein
LPPSVAIANRGLQKISDPLCLLKALTFARKNEAGLVALKAGELQQLCRPAIWSTELLAEATAGKVDLSELLLLRIGADQLIDN